VEWLFPKPAIPDPFVFSGYNLYGYATKLFKEKKLVLSFAGSSNISAVVSISADYGTSKYAV